ncbi:hypothetical protein [Chitinophaga ginsengisoli]|uniref:GDSL-like lipase/acylhydrolase family protein n=1 Tax=Chitinophaga ginsengisoli TaxID=363837 RepID=A0A2P8FKZ5_9BACT|nr:hypothetical protein [Chitinophaga ginsengisoli]PSL22381.1 hypothetical protein CLV42_1227 [Chitinophaga ginsengisoli]
MKKLLPILLSIILLCSFRKKELTWVAIGDSITYLNDHLDETVLTIGRYEHIPVVDLYHHPLRCLSWKTW